MSIIVPVELTEAFPIHLQWMNEPQRWEWTRDGRLRIHTDPQTDFWQRTHYGFMADSGHLLHLLLTGDFEMTTNVTFRPLHQYDQAGLMIRFSANCWLKTSVEFEPDGQSRLGVVVTNNGYSDWSTQDFSSEHTEIVLSLKRAGADFHVHYALPGKEKFSQLRIAHLFEAQDAMIAQCGLYACSPKQAGFCADFAYLQFKQ